MKSDESDLRASAFDAHGQVVQCIRSEAHRCANEGTSLAVIAVEFDGFDALAASEGETAAEEIFGKLLRAVQVHCGRDRDHVFRMASDRIIAVCPKTLPAGARHIASQIRDSAEQLPAQADGSPVTLSIGISAAAPGSEEDTAELLDRAERSLEAAREGGGNRIVGAAATTTSPAPGSLRNLVASVLPKKQTASARRTGD